MMEPLQSGNFARHTPPSTIARAPGALEMTRGTGNTWRTRRPIIVASAVFAVAVVASVVMWQLVMAMEQRALQARFDELAEEAVLRLRDGFRSGEQILRGASVLLGTSSNVSRAEWHSLVKSQGVGDGNPSIASVGFVELVKRQDVRAHEARIRGEGYVHYRIFPVSARDEYAPIVYVEPFSGRNAVMLGYDVSSDPVRKAAMARALRTGEPTLTAQLNAMTEEAAQPDLVMFMPVYQGPGVRHSAYPYGALRGYAYVRFRLNDFLTRSWHLSALTLDLKLYELAVAPDHLLFRNTAPSPAVSACGALHTQRAIELYGRRFVVEVACTEALLSGHGTANANWLLFAGLVAALLLSGVAWAGVANREKVNALAAANQSLLHATSLLRMASNVARMGAWKVDLPSGKLTWSDEVRAIHETPKDFAPEVERAISFYAPEYRATITDAFEHCATQGTPYDLELEIVTMTGRRVWVRAVGEALRDDAGEIRCVQGAFQDISRQKTVEAERLRLTMRLQNTLDSITDAFFTVDHDWRFTYVNDEAERMLHRSRSLLLRERLWDMFPEAVGTVFQQEYHRAMRDRCSVSFTAFYAPLDIWVDVHAYPSEEGLTICARNITQRKQAEDKMRQQAELLDATTEAILVRDLDNRIRYWNKAAERLYGWSADEAVGVSVEDLFYVDDSGAFVDATRHVMEFGQWTGRMREKCKDGRCVVVEGHWNLVRDEAGRPHSVLAINTDLRDRLELEARLAQTQQLEALGQLTGGLAHDFNNLLTAIIGSAELLREAIDADEDLMSLVHTILGAAERGAELTSRLLAFARRQDLEPQPVDPALVIDDMRPLLEQALGKSVTLAVVCEPDLWHAFADPVQLASSVLNLCINARDAMSGGGSVEIHVGNYHAPGDRGTDELEGDYVVICVRDTGHGMSSEVLAHAFDPFFTTKERGKGTGLGLSMVYGFAKQSRGIVKLHSEVERGTSVELYLPRASDRYALAGGSMAAPPLMHGSEHILLVEDDEHVGSHAARLLRRLGYSVDVAANAHAGLALLKENPGRYALLFTDIVMPGGMYGTELASLAQRIAPEIAVLLATGHARDCESQKHEVRGLELLRKPYRKHEVAAKIRAVLDRAAERATNAASRQSADADA